MNLIHPYRDTGHYQQFHCTAITEHCNGLGIARCTLNLGHSGYHWFDDHEDWHPEIYDYVLVNRPLKHNQQLLGMAGRIDDIIYSEDALGDKYIINFWPETMLFATFVKNELSLYLLRE